MVYTKEEIFTLFENSEIIVKVEKGYLINAAFQRSLRGKKRKDVCMNYPEEFIGLSDTIIYKKVLVACKIPLMYKGDISYLVRTQTKASVRALKQILKTPSIDYNKFVAKVSDFYRSSIALPGFAKFLVESTWETVYDAEYANNQRDQKGVI